MRNSKSYDSYRLNEVLKLTPEEFTDLLSYETYNLVLIYRLLDLRSYFIENEMYEFLIPIQSFFDEFDVSIPLNDNN